MVTALLAWVWCVLPIRQGVWRQPWPPLPPDGGVNGKLYDKAFLGLSSLKNSYANSCSLKEQDQIQLSGEYHQIKFDTLQPSSNTHVFYIIMYFVYYHRISF